MRINIRYTLLAILMQSSLGLQAQRFAYMDELPRASFGSPVYNNAFLHSTPDSRHVNVRIATADGMFRNAPVQGSVFSKDLFDHKSRNRSTIAYMGFTNISAYRHLSADDIGRNSGPNFRGISPPPPTPDPDQPHVLPVSDAWWCMAVLLLGYSLILYRRRKATNRQ